MCYNVKLIAIAKKNYTTSQKKFFYFGYEGKHMHFFDEVQITVTSGKGWNGCVSARREKGVPYGWPNGGNGWNGWSVIFQANHNLSTLQAFTLKNHYKAEDGEHGRGKDQYGANGNDLVLMVPCGTIIRDAETMEIYAELTNHHDQWLACQGGQGGQGNMHFANAVMQYPHFALNGEPSRTKNLILEVQLLADIGLIGAPSVGKTTLINTLSNAKAKVADYPFTTLIPNLGVVRHGDASYTLVDIPWLIQWASQGKWLGNAFLRHICKTSVMMLITDASRYDQWVDELITIWDEIMTYLTDRFPPQKEPTLTAHNGSLVWDHGHPHIGPKVLCFGISKTDLVVDHDIIEEIRTLLIARLHDELAPYAPTPIPKETRIQSVHAFSCGTNEGITPLLASWQTLLHKPLLSEPESPAAQEDLPQYHTSRSRCPSLDIQLAHWEDVRELRQLGYTLPEGKSLWHCADDDLARVVAMTMRDRDQGVQRFWTVAEKEGRLTACDRAGVQIGDILLVHGPYTNPLHVLVYTKGWDGAMMTN